MTALSDLVKGFGDAVAQLAGRVRVLEASDRAEVAGGVQATAFADLPVAGQPGRLRFVTDGTPGLYEDDGAAWVLLPPTASVAPSTADYLVGTAQAGLSAEIVVGTTPGGELGGTWAAPTVDATHSGSKHFLEATVTLTDALIRALFVTPVQVLAAPGANLMNVIHRIVAVATIANSTPYAGGGNIRITGNGAVNTLATNGLLTGSLTRTQVSATNLIPGSTVITADLTNKAYFIDNVTAAFTGGDAASVLTLKIWYTIELAALV